MTAPTSREELLALADRLAAPHMNKSRYEERMLNGDERDLIVAALRGVAQSAGQPLAWHCCDDRYPFIRDIVTTNEVTVEAWRESGIEFQPLYPHAEVREVTDEIVERAWAAIVGDDVAGICFQASIIRADLRDGLVAALAALPQSTDGGGK